MQGQQQQAEFQRAHQAYAAGDLALAERLTTDLLRRAPGFAPSLQLAAVIARRLGRTMEARQHFAAALTAAPRDPHILNSYANLLLELGDAAGALPLYRKAVELAPDLPGTRVNLALAAKRAGFLDEAQAALEEATRLFQRHAPAWQALGVLHLERQRPDEAAHALDQALALKPNDERILRARATAEAGLTLAGAVEAFRAGDHVTAIASVEAVAAARPDLVEAHTTLARMRWQSGDAAGFARSFETALAEQPRHPGLWEAYLAALIRAGCNREVLARIDAARQALGPAADRFEAAAATESGDLTRADVVFARANLAADPSLQISHLRHLLRAGRPEAAARAAEAIGAAAWPYLATAWRLLGDPRWQWLEGDPAFIQIFHLPIEPGLAEHLRGLHRTRAAPFDQTLRGGTQTEGNLFAEPAPEIDRLRRQFTEAVHAYLARLPPRDGNHPLLGPDRSAPALAGGWSVRLTDAGFHLNHVHPHGWISSAYYVSLPPLAGEEGCLTFGEPPAELGLGLPPIRAITPQPGRLVLFPSTLWHGTRPFPTGERLTVAFDVTPG